MSNVAVQKAAADLKAEQAMRHQCEERISVMERELKDATGKCKSLEEDNKAKAYELYKALQHYKKRHIRDILGQMNFFSVIHMTLL